MADKIENVINNIDKLISKTHEQIDLLNELKKSVIFNEQGCYFGSVSITMTQAEFIDFKRAYNTAVSDSQKSFIYKGQRFLTVYAEYLLKFWSVNDE